MGNGKKKRSSRVTRNSLVYYSKPVRKPERNFNWRLFWFLIKLLLLLFLVIYIYCFSPIFKIKDVIISGNDKIPTERIEMYVPKSGNIFSFNAGEVERNIINIIPEIKSVKIYKGIPNALKIIVEEQQPNLLWQSGISYYLVNDGGVAYKDVTSSITEYGSLARINDLRNLPVKLQTQIVSNHFILFTNKIFSEIKEQANVDPDYFAIDETTVDLYLYTKNGFFIKFDTLRDADMQTANLKLILVQRRSDVHEYVDLRVNGWAYIK